MRLATWGIVMGLVETALLSARAAEAVGERTGRELGGGDYTMINNVLSELRVTVDAGNIPEITADSGVMGIKVFIRVNPRIECRKFGIGSVDVARERLGDENGMQRLNVGLVATNVQLECDVRLCVKTSLPFNDYDCSGYLTIASNANAGTKLAMSQNMYSPNFDKQLPVRAEDAGIPCQDMISMNNIQFSGYRIKSIMGFDITGAIVNALNGGSRDMAITQIRQAGCDALTPLKAQLSTFLVSNPVVDILQVPAPNEDALVLERELPSLFPEAALVEIGNNVLTNVVLPTRPVSENSELVELVIDPANSAIQYAVDMLEELLNASGASNGGEEFQGLLSLAFETLFQQPLPRTPESSLDLVAAIASVLGQREEDLLAKLAITESVDGVGDFAVNVLNLKLTTKQGWDEPAGAVYGFPFLGKQTLGAPVVRLGDLVLSAQVRFSPTIKTTILGQPIILSWKEQYTVEAGITQFAVRLAALLAVDESRISELEMGSISEWLFECILSLFVQTPRMSQVDANSDKIGLQVSKCADGLGCILQDLINTAALAYGGGMSNALRSYVSTLGTNTSLTGEEAYLCPSFANSSAAAEPEMQLLFNFSQGLVHQVSDLVNADLANQLVSSVNGSLAVVSEPTALLDLYVPSAIGGIPEQRLLLSVNSIVVGLDKVHNLELLSASADSPQDLENRLAASKLFLEANFLIDSQAAQRRVLQIQPGENIIEPGQSNNVTIRLGVSGLDAALEWIATYSRLAIAATKVDEMLSIDCWVGKLEQGGGLHPGAIKLLLEGGDLRFICNSCDSPALVELARKMADQGARDQLFNILAELKDKLFGLIEDEFSPERWNYTVASAAARCAGLPVDDTRPDTQDDLGSLEADEAMSHTLLAGVAGLLLAAACFTCYAPYAGKLRNAKLRNSEQVKPEESGSLAASADADGCALWAHPSVPRWLRFAMPILLLANTICFVLGHIGYVISISVLGGIFGQPIELPDVAQFSVITSTQEMIKAGATVLGGLIIMFSIVWPYLKLVLMSLCWLSPIRIMGSKARGKLLRFLDRAGKFSMVELYVITFILIMLDISVNAPDAVLTFLPENLYTIRMAVEPQYNLFTFTAALLMSLLLSNVMSVFQERIEDKARLRDAVGSDVFQSLVDNESQNVQRLSTEDKCTLFQPILPSQAPSKSVFTYVKTTGAVLLALTGFIITLYASSLPVLRVEIVGLAAKAIELGGESPVAYYSLFTFIGKALHGNTSGAWFYGLALIATSLVIPLLYILSLAVVSVAPVSLVQAMRARLIIRSLSAWCALEIFLLAVGVAVLELPMLTKMLLANQCDGVQGIIQNYLLPLGLINMRDAQAGCFALSATVQEDVFYFLVALVVTFIVHVVVVHALDGFIDRRLAAARSGLRITSQPKPQIKFGNSFVVEERQGHREENPTDLVQEIIREHSRSIDGLQVV